MNVSSGWRATITIPIHIAGAIDGRGVQFWFMAVRVMIAMVPPVVIALLAQRYIVRGLTLGRLRAECRLPRPRPGERPARVHADRA